MPHTMPHSAEKTYVKNVLAYSAPPRTAGTHQRQPANEEPQVKLTLRGNAVFTQGKVPKYPIFLRISRASLLEIAKIS